MKALRQILFLLLASCLAGAGIGESAVRFFSGTVKETLVFKQVSTALPDYTNATFIQVANVADANQTLEVTTTFRNIVSRTSLSTWKANKTRKKWWPKDLEWSRKYSRVPSEIRQLSVQIATGRLGQDEFVEGCFQWIAARITPEKRVNPDEEPALLTLERRKGSCVGQTNLLQALLRAQNIPCRTVHGLRKAGAWEFHRWLEVYFPGAGWVFFDPPEAMYAVPASTAVLFIEDSPIGTLPEGLPEDLPDRIALQQSQDNLTPVDFLPGQGALVVSCPRGSVRYSAGVTGLWSLPDAPEFAGGSLHFEGPGNPPPVTYQNGWYTALPVHSGTYRVVFQSPKVRRVIKDHFRVLPVSMLRLDVVLSPPENRRWTEEEMKRIEGK